MSRLMDRLASLAGFASPRRTTTRSQAGRRDAVGPSRAAATTNVMRPQRPRPTHVTWYSRLSTPNPEPRALTRVRESRRSQVAVPAVPNRGR